MKNKIKIREELFDAIYPIIDFVVSDVNYGLRYVSKIFDVIFTEEVLFCINLGEV